jgi:lysyl-tRNA synthetase class I
MLSSQSKKGNYCLDKELVEVINKRLESTSNKTIVIGTGITSSHTGDGRNLREYIFGSEINNYLQSRGFNTMFYLADDSFDSLTYEQLKIALNKNPKLIKRFLSYCGTPIRLIPDPYGCHSSYSQHFQSEILDRFHTLDIHPIVFDVYNAYSSGMYDFAKKIIFPRYETVQKHLGRKFPKYTMKKIFWPLCPNCQRIDSTEIIDINKNRIKYLCNECHLTKSEDYIKIQGKFSWKIDCAVKWNVFKTDFEAFYKAYLDPHLGSYFIAKEISEKFFDGWSPSIVEHGQILIDRDLSNIFLSCLPTGLTRFLFLKDRKKDITISKSKIKQLAKEYTLAPGISYLDYVKSKLSDDAIRTKLCELDNGQIELIKKGVNFSEKVLGITIFPKVPNEEELEVLSRDERKKIEQIFRMVIKIRSGNSVEYSEFRLLFNKFLEDSSIVRNELFPKIRIILSQVSGVPLSRTLYHLQITFLMQCLSVIGSKKHI